MITDIKDHTEQQDSDKLYYKKPSSTVAILYDSFITKIKVCFSISGLSHHIFFLLSVER